MITCLVSILFISLHGVQVDCNVDSYSFRISENGTMVTEVIEVDVDNQTEVFRVPQHNDVDAMDMMNDFKVGLSVYRIPSARACYVSKLDSSLPGPEKMKFNMEQASVQPLPSHVTTKESAWRVVGFAYRPGLPQKFLDFCGSFPIYTIEQTSMHSGMRPLRRGHGRRKRHHILTSFPVCGEKGRKSVERCLSKRNEWWIKYHIHVDYSLKCAYVVHSSRYVVDCTPVRNGQYVECDKIVHFVNYLGLCCEYMC